MALLIHFARIEEENARKDMGKSDHIHAATIVMDYIEKFDQKHSHS